MRNKVFAVAIAAVFAISTFHPPEADAQAKQRSAGRLEYTNMLFKKSVIVGTSTNRGADSSALLHVGDTACLGGILLPRTDTNKITNPTLGVLIMNRGDTSLRMWIGNRWKKMSYP